MTVGKSLQFDTFLWTLPSLWMKSVKMTNFLENIKCENIECCCDYVLATHAHAWPLFPRWTSTSMQKFDKNILFAPALLSPWPQECQNMLSERKVNTFAKSQPPKHHRFKGCWCNLHHASGHVDFDGHIQKVIKCTSRPWNLSKLRDCSFWGKINDAKKRNSRHFLICNKSA